jgi:hypothetical protein
MGLIPFGAKRPEDSASYDQRESETITTAVVADRSPINGPGDLREETFKRQDADLSAVEMSEKTLTDGHHPERD